MQRIQVLDRTTADLIAAGEVVERPASVIKELVENAVDAGATAVTVEIRDGGITYMRVTDNGCGMEPQDASTAFLRHATSKISCGDDLFRIGTLGFRGEALAAISVVSRVELITKTAAAEEGINIRLVGGEILYEDSIGCPDGTTMIVEDLFYNTPARMKFLKKNTTEAAAVATVVDKLAMVCPKVAFTFVKDGKQELFTTGNGDVSAAIYAVYGKALADDLVALSGSGKGLRVTGYLAKPDAGKPSRTYQSFFVNGRFIKSRMLTAALDDGCKSYFERDKHPLCVLMIEADSALVDVNVHPTKMEVKFSDEREVYSAVYFAVKNAYGNLKSLSRARLLGDGEEQGQALPFTVGEEPQQAALCGRTEPLLDRIFQNAPNYPAVGAAFYNNQVRACPKEEEPSVLGQADFSAYDPSVFPETTETSAGENEVFPKEYPQVQQRDPVIIGQLFDTYIIAELGDEVLYIDKHAAQERLIYESIKSQKDRQGMTQELMTPQTVSLSREETAEVLENLEFLNSLGFELEEFGNDTLLVRGVPMNTSRSDAGEVIEAIAFQLTNGKKDVPGQLYDKVMYSIACKAAVKGGQKNGYEELLRLTKNVLAMPDVRFCPHGRPVAVFLTKSTFEKQFGRA